jgi:hypothetical protein
MQRIGISILPRLAGRAVLVLGLALAGQLVLPPPAQAAATLTVSTTADVSADFGACGDAGITTAPSPLSLREATCLADNLGGDVTISVPAGTYQLTNGELRLGAEPGQNITLTGAGQAGTVIDAGGLNRVLELDFNLTGGISTSISGVTLRGGSDDTYGGGGIIAGSGYSDSPDTVTISDSTITGNQTTSTATDLPGGGVQFIGGSLNITNSTISNNSSGNSAGSGVYYLGLGVVAGEQLSITGSTLSGNSALASAAGVVNGGALWLSGASYDISSTRFVGNTATATGGRARGAAIWSQGGALTVTGSTFTSNAATGPTGAGGAIAIDSGSATLHYNRLTGNTAASGSGASSQGGATMNATENWWGCNTGPNTAGCETTSGAGITATPRLVLTAIASPNHVIGPNGTATLTASLLTDSLGSAVGAANLAGAFSGLPVSFSDPPGDATVTLAAGAHNVNLAAGVASIDYHSNTTLGPDNDLVTLDNGALTDVLEVDEPPTITSANTAPFTPGQPGSFTISTVGFPAATITESGSLPSGLTFHDNGDGSATISGTPTAGGNFALTVTAANGYSPNATQTLTLNLGRPPAITSAASTTFVIGQAGTFTVTTSGSPTVSAITETGTLPAGITFTDKGNGTATLAGTPTGTGNTYPVTLTASNGVTPNATQNLTVQVNQAPTVTSNPVNQTVQPGTSVSFTATASGVPTPTVQWQVSTDGGASFANLAGATATIYTFTAQLSQNGNQYRAVFSNGIGMAAATTAATVYVGTAPAFTSADHTTLVVGQAGSFAITTAGTPAPILSRTGIFPAWLTLTDNGDGTGSLTGTPPAGSGGTYGFTLKAANGFSPSASQNFTLFVDESPSITSVDHTTFTVGNAGTFAVTTAAGFPTTTTFTETGALPSGVTFIDNGDGTATLGGTATSGGVFHLTIKASNGVAPDASQAFTLTVNASPVITSTDHTTFAVGSAGAFTVTTSPGTPAATTITRTGALPSGVTFTDNGDGTAAIAGTPNTGSEGVYPITITASNGSTPDARQTFTLAVNAPPQITSVDHTTFTLDTAGNFTVTTAGGYPTLPVLTETGALPSGVTFTDNGDGTATLAGTPAAGSGGSYPLTLTATNGVAPNATQAFTLTVSASPVITSTDHTTFAVGSAGTFTVTTTPGNPAATTITETGALPSGVSFADNGNGTATLAGTPAVGTGGSYSLTITASNGVLPNAAQAFTLTINELPTITSANHATFQVGSAGTFTVTATAGFPTAITLTKVGTLPSGTTFTDNGDGTATLAGTAAAGTGGTYSLTLTATNAAGHKDQAFTLTVTASPTITSANHATFTVNVSGTFTVTTTGGFPTATTLTETGALPTGVTFHDNGNGTATLSGKPTVGGTFTITIRANNGVAPVTTQTFTLTVNGPPVFTSANTTTFITGNNCGRFPVTTTATGSPGTTTLTESGTLPTGVTFTNNGNGTATLSGCVSGIASKKTFALTFTATNPVGTATQAFSLIVQPPGAVPLPSTLPPSNGTLSGLNAPIYSQSSYTVSGSGYAPGAPITIGYYPGPVTVTTTNASATGTFSAILTMPAPGTYTYVAAGADPNGNPRYLEATTTVYGCGVCP